MGTVIALSGQIGGAKLADGLYRIRNRDLTVIVNNGDDYEHIGLTFCPDLDTMLYTMSGLASERAGWEPEGETYAMFDTLKRLGGPDRLPVGDRSLAIPILRSEGLAMDRRLTEITLDFCRHLGVAARVLPMSDDRVRTQVNTEDGAVTFQDYFFALACEPVVKSFEYAGADDARISDELLDALHAPDIEAVVICPANPYHTIGPILAIPGLRELLKKSGAPIVAVSPIIGGQALKGSAAKIMRELGREVTARAIAVEYVQLIDGLVIDSEDEALADGIRACGMDVMATKTIMRSLDDRATLAQSVLEFAQSIRARKEAEAGA